MYLVTARMNEEVKEYKQKSFIRAKRLAYQLKMQGYSVEIKEIKR